jgi:hypothetical protein
LLVLVYAPFSAFSVPLMPCGGVGSLGVMPRGFQPVGVSGVLAPQQGGGVQQADALLQQRRQVLERAEEAYEVALTGYQEAEDAYNQLMQGPQSFQQASSVSPLGVASGFQSPVQYPSLPSLPNPYLVNQGGEPSSLFSGFSLSQPLLAGSLPVTNAQSLEGRLNTMVAPVSHSPVAYPPAGAGFSQYGQPQPQAQPQQQQGQPSQGQLLQQAQPLSPSPAGQPPYPPAVQVTPEDRATFQMVVQTVDPKMGQLVGLMKPQDIDAMLAGDPGLLGAVRQVSQAQKSGGLGLPQGVPAPQPVPSMPMAPQQGAVSPNVAYGGGYIPRR